MDRAEFSFDFGEGASTIYHALLPETREAFPRSRAALSVDGGLLHLIVDAEDVTALRAWMADCCTSSWMPRMLLPYVPH